MAEALTNADKCFAELTLRRFCSTFRLLSGSYFPAALGLAHAAGKCGGTFLLANAAARDAVLLGRVQPTAEGHAGPTFLHPGAAQAVCQWRQCVPHGLR